MFNAQSIEEIAGDSAFVSDDMAGILNTGQHMNMIKEVAEEVKGKKEAFLRHKEKEASKLRNILCKLFTTVLVRRTKTVLLNVRGSAEHRMNEISVEHENKAALWGIVQDKQELTKTRARKAERALTELLELATSCLSSSDQEVAEPNSQLEALQCLVTHITSEINAGNQSLPEVAVTNDDEPTVISGSGFDLLPEEIKNVKHSDTPSK